MDEKEDNQIIEYVTIIVPGRDKSHLTSTPSLLLSPILPLIISTLLLLASEITLNTNLPKKTRFGHISQTPKQYNAGINNYVKILLSQLIEVFVVADCGIKENCLLYSSQINNKCNALVFLTQKIWAENVRDLDNYAYITNNFDIKEPETYEKVMASKQAKERIEVMKKEI